MRFPTGIFIGPELLRHRPVDDHHVAPRAAILVREPASAKQPNSQSAEIVRRDTVFSGDWRWSCGNGVRPTILKSPFMPPWSNGTLFPAPTATVPGSARNRGKVVEERDPLRALLVLCWWKRNAHGQHIFRMEAGVDVQHSPETRQQKTGAAQQHASDGNLRRHQHASTPIAAAGEMSPAFSEPLAQLAHRNLERSPMPHKLRSARRCQ